MPRPKNNRYYAPFFQQYIDRTTGDSIAAFIANHEAEINTFYSNLPEEKAMNAYAAGNGL